MKIKITRQFDRTRQIADFVPVRSSCEVSVEYDDAKLKSDKVEYREKCLQSLDEICKRNVEASLMGYVPCCVVCGGKNIFPGKPLNKMGYCDQCDSKLKWEAKEFAAKNVKDKQNHAKETDEGI